MILFFALLLDWLIGDPPGLWKRIPHPVVWIGNGIGFLDAKLNISSLYEAEARGRGLVLLLLVVGLALFAGAALSYSLGSIGLVGWIVEIVIVSIFIAQKSLKDHVSVVAQSLQDNGVDAGRRAVSQIVGRNTKELDEPGICRAAIESLAENFSDGVVAPVFWYLVLGLPGLIAYKAVNTADSMIGHKNRQYLHFGWAAAKLDDLMNWPAARISALLIAIAAGIRGGTRQSKLVLQQSLQDAGLHRSPNAGWPESAMAASLDVALGGPRAYEGETVLEPVLNAGSSLKISVSDIERAINIFSIACFSLWLFVAFFGFLPI